MIVSRPVIRAIGEGWAWILGRRQRVRVSGPSMEPTLIAGEFVLVDSRRSPNVNDIVVARHPDDDELLVIKRVAAVEPDGRLTVSSDNPDAGTDSRAWGPLPTRSVLGVVTLVLDRVTADPLQPPRPDSQKPPTTT